MRVILTFQVLKVKFHLKEENETLPKFNFCKLLKNKEHSNKELLIRFRMNVHTLGFNSQNQIKNLWKTQSLTGLGVSELTGSSFQDVVEKHGDCRKITFLINGDILYVCSTLVNAGFGPDFIILWLQ